MIDAQSVKQQGRDPVKTAEVFGWKIEVYRVGRRHEYQALAIGPDGEVMQTPRVGGYQAMTQAMIRATTLINGAKT
jgi:hypothetical protein